jgi:hypothetical protein
MVKRYGDDAMLEASERADQAGALAGRQGSQRAAVTAKQINRSSLSPVIRLRRFAHPPTYCCYQGVTECPRLGQFEVPNPSA